MIFLLLLLPIIGYDCGYSPCLSPIFTYRQNPAFFPSVFFSQTPAYSSNCGNSANNYRFFQDKQTKLSRIQ